MKKQKKLKLARQTLRNLSGNNLQAAVGGMVAQTNTIDGEECCCDSIYHCALTAQTPPCKR